MLNGNLGAQWEVMCSSGVLNGNLGARWECMCSTGHYWSSQWEINGMHIVVVVNNILNVKQSPSRVLSHMNLMCGVCMEGWIELRTLSFIGYM